MRQKEINPNKVAIYVRWSTDDQGEGSTLPVQSEGCKHYVLSQGWNVRDDLIFIDDGYSGGNLNRPAMTQLRELVNKGEIDCIVVYKLDRLSRSVIDTAKLAEEWENITHLKSAREPVDTTTPMGRQIFYLLASFAEWERNQIKDRTYSGKVNKAKGGLNAGYVPPYGYIKGDKPGRFQEVESEVKVVQRIYQLYADGVGMSKIAYQLTEEGYKPRKGKMWSKSSVANILNNPFYVGVVQYGKSMVNPRKGKENEPNRYYTKDPAISVKSEYVEPIISDELYTKVKEIRDKNNVKVSGRSGRTISNDHLLSGLVKCQCGYSQMLQLKHERVWYYHCHGRRLMGKEFCDAKYIREDELDPVVVDYLKNIFLGNNDGINTMDLLLQQQRDAISNVNMVITNLSKDIAKNNAHLEKLTGDYLSGTITATMFTRLSSQLENTINTLSSSLISKQNELVDIEQNTILDSAVVHMGSMLERWEMLTLQQKKHLLQEWIDEIIAFKDQDGRLHVKILYALKGMGTSSN
jgi:site-specific DNA recombinase